MRFRATLAFVISITWALACSPLTLGTAMASGEASGDWTATLDGDASWQQATPTGVLVLGTHSGIVGLEGASGRLLWRIADLHPAKEIALDVLPRPPYALLRLKKGIRGHVVRIVIDVTTGHEIWDSSTLGLSDAWQQLYVPSLDALIIAGKAAEGDVILMADVATGRLLHTISPPRGEARSMLEDLNIFDTDSTLTIRSDDKVVRYSLGTGTMLWSSSSLVAGQQMQCGTLPDPAPGPGKPAQQRSDPRPLPPPAPIALANDGRRIFTLEGPALHAVDVRDGRLFWHRPPGLCGRCVEVIEVEGGVLARTMPELSGNDVLYMLEGSSGAVRWQYPAAPKGLGSFFKTALELGDHLSNPVVNAGVVHVVAGRTLMRIDLATGESKKLGKTRIDEDATLIGLERVEEGFLVVGTQELEWMDEHGRSVRHVHYDPPDDLGVGLVLLGATAALRAAGPMTTRRGNWTFSLGRPGYGSAMHRLMREYHATSALDSLVFMLADLDDADIKGSALVAINKRTGQTLRRISVPKRPNYSIDDLHGWVFVIDGKSVSGHAL